MAYFETTVFGLSARLLEGNKEAACCTFRNSHTIRTAIPFFRRKSCVLFIFSQRYFVHFSDEIRLVFLTEEQAEVVILFIFTFLSELELFLVTWRIAETEMFGDRALASTRNHRQ